MKIELTDEGRKRVYMRDRVADLEAVCSAQEFTFWDVPAGNIPRRTTAR